MYRSRVATYRLHRSAQWRRRLALGALFATGCALTLLVTPAHAQWKWRDAGGRITASDLPPPASVPEMDILQRPAAPARREAAAAATAAAPAAASAPALVAAKPAGDPELEKRRKAAEEDAAAKARAEEERLAAQRRENCTRARSHLATMESGQRVARMNDKGEREFLDDKARADEMRRAREVIAADCR
jgi:hypothetical protein